MTHTDVMLDLETLGTKPGSVILSIGAVAFSVGQPEAEWSTYDSGPINAHVSRGFGPEMDTDTLAWWLAQESAAKGLLHECLQHKTEGPALAFRKFAEWFPADANLWGNGADFDNVLLKAAWRVVGFPLPLPWSYSSNRCYRTMKRVFEHVSPPEFQGVKHNALADALHQTRHLQTIMKFLEETPA